MPKRRSNSKTHLSCGSTAPNQNRWSGEGWLEAFPRENPEPVLACKPDGQLVYFNPATRQIMKRLGLTKVEAFLPEKHVTLAGQCFSRKSAVISERHAAGRDYEWSYHAVQKDDICHIYGHDITKRKQAESRLRDSELWFRTVVETLHEGLIVTDLDERIVYVNSSMAELCGRKTEDLIGTSADLLWPEQDRKDIAQRTVRRHAGHSERYEAQMLRRGVEPIWVEVSAVPYRDWTGTITGCFGLLMDITERRKSEEERLKLEAQVRRAQKLETIGTLAGGIAHDFNNILTPILGYADMAVMDLPPGGVTRSNIEHVIHAAYRAKDLIRQILMFSRQVEQERKPIQLHPVLKEALKLTRASIPATIEIRDRISANCPPVMADPSQIHQVLMNLCTNSFHAMRDKGGVLEVGLTTLDVDENLARTRPNLHEGHYVRITVSDSGHGMAPETLERIFEPFFTTKEVGEGTGLGLSVVHGIVRNNGGDISVYSEPGRGTTFHIYLPAVNHDMQSEGLVEEPIPPGHEHVLLVDDDREIAIMGQQMLERLGYRVTVRTSSIEALEAFRARAADFDVVVTDQTMPQMTGGQLAQELQGIRPGIPVVLITGFSETMTAENSTKFGIREYVMKPIVLRDLSAAIRRALDTAAVSLS